MRSTELERLEKQQLEADDAAWTVFQLGEVLYDQGNLEAALAKLEEALELYRAAHGDKPNAGAAR